METFRSTAVTNTGTTVLSNGVDVTGVNIINLHNAAIFVKFYNSDVATFQDTPVRVYQVAASSSFPSVPVPVNNTDVLFSTSEGLTIRVVTSGADNNDTAATTAPIIELQYKK